MDYKKKYQMRINSKLSTKQDDNDEWETIELDNRAIVHMRFIDDDIVKQMPEATETFIERRALRTFLNRMGWFVRSGS